MNKALILFISIITAHNAFAQRNENPLYYLNSERVNIEKQYINPQSIDAINVTKETPNGEINITSKGKIEFWTLTEVLEKYSEIKQLSDNILIRIDGNYITDVSDIMIDKSFFIYIETEKLLNISYLNEKFRELVIANISLEAKERKPQIFIRGKDTLNSPSKVKKQIEE